MRNRFASPAVEVIVDPEIGPMPGMRIKRGMLLDHPGVAVDPLVQIREVVSPGPKYTGGQVGHLWTITLEMARGECRQGFDAAGQVVPELAEETTDQVCYLDPPPRDRIVRAMDEDDRLPVLGLGHDERHGRSPYGVTDRLGIHGVGLAALDVEGRLELQIVARPAELPTSVVGRSQASIMTVHRAMNRGTPDA